MDQEIEDSILPVQSTQNEEVEEFDFEVALKKRG